MLLMPQISVLVPCSPRLSLPDGAPLDALWIVITGALRTRDWVLARSHRIFTYLNTPNMLSSPNKLVFTFWSLCVVQSHLWIWACYLNSSLAFKSKLSAQFLKDIVLCNDHRRTLTRTRTVSLPPQKYGNMYILIYPASCLRFVNVAICD